MTDAPPPPSPDYPSQPAQAAQPNPYASQNPYASSTPYTAAPAQKTNVLAIVSLVLSILWISIPGVVCGHIALNQIKKTGESGRGLAIAGLVVGYIGIVGGLLLVVLWIGLFAVAGVNSYTTY